MDERSALIMKKTAMRRIVPLLALVLALALSLALAGCGQSAEEKTAAALQELLSTLQSGVDEQSAQAGTNEFMDITCSMRDEALVFTYALKQELPDGSDTEDMLAAIAEAQKGQFVPMIGELQKAPYNLKSPTVIIEFLTMDGGVIYSVEFTGE
jgi:hypothetical protein